MTRRFEKIAVSLAAMAALTAFAASSASSPSDPASAASPGQASRLQVRSVQARLLAKIPNAAFADLAAMADVQGKMYGAGPRRVVLIGENGSITRTIPVDVAEVAGLAPYLGGTLILGDCGLGAIHTVNLESGKSSLLFRLSELRWARSGKDPWDSGDVPSLLGAGKLASLAFDGTSIYAATSAGYSSSIFKIDPNARRVLARSWAPGPSSNAMTFDAGNLYVLDAAGNAVRRLDGALKLSPTSIPVPVSAGRGLVIRGNELRVLSPKERAIVRVETDLRVFTPFRAAVSAINKISRATGIKVVDFPKKYALLICGDVAESGFDEFWNDTVWIYKTLRGLGYSAANIYVLYGDGADYASANPRYQSSETVTDFPATTAWVNTVLDGLKNGDAGNGIKALDGADSLFVWTFDHGAGGSAAYLCLRDGNMSDTSFAAKINAAAYGSRAIYMQQCHSGGFIDNLANAKTFISTACRATEGANRSDTENEAYSGLIYNHGEYNYHLITSMSGTTPGGSAVNCDANSDGMISAQEVHTWIAGHESNPEVPQVQDTAGVGLTFKIR